MPQLDSSPAVVDIDGIARRVIDEDESGDPRLMAKAFILALEDIDPFVVIELIAAEWLRDLATEAVHRPHPFGGGGGGGGGGGTSSRSWRWANAGAYADFLNRQETIDGLIVRVGDMTAPELRAAHDLCRERARAEMYRAQRYERLADRLDATGLEHVGDLPTSELAAALS